VHSIRLPGYMIVAPGHHRDADQRLTIRHDSSGAQPYGKALLAIRKVSALTGLHRGLDSVLDL
jgi:4-hydroxy-tetrahydrodipicolinate reductase